MIRRVLIAFVAVASVAIAQTDPAAEPQAAGMPMRIMTFNCEDWSYHYGAKGAQATTRATFFISDLNDELGLQE